MIKCENCGKTYDYMNTDGLCPKCGAYNQGTSGNSRNEMQFTEQHGGETFASNNSNQMQYTEQHTGTFGASNNNEMQYTEQHERSTTDIYEEGDTQENGTHDHKSVYGKFDPKCLAEKNNSTYTANGVGGYRFTPKESTDAQKKKLTSIVFWLIVLAFIILSAIGGN